MKLKSLLFALFALPLTVCAQDGRTVAEIEGVDIESLIAATSEQQEATEARESDDLPATERESSSPVDIWDRIRAGYKIPELTGRRVDASLRLYSRDPKLFMRVSERAGKYLYHIVEEVEKRGMPSELALLPFVESAFNAEATSSAKAAGLWQFMPGTAKVYSLQHSLFKDDRRDVLESTRAALDYLERLHTLFGDWQLALAAYNWGEGNVMRAVRRNRLAKRSTNYSSLRMPRETANYLPRLEAVKRIVADPDKYKVELPEIENAPYFVRVAKSRDIDTQTAAKLAQMDTEDFRMLNPAFNLPVVVANHNAYMLLPNDNVEIFLDNLAGWLNAGKPLTNWVLYRVHDNESVASIAKKHGMSEEELREVNRLPKGRNVKPGSTLLVDAGSNVAPDIAHEDLSAKVHLAEPETRRFAYRVKKGDTIYDIAKKYGVTQKSIRSANRLGSSRLKIGQRLTIVVPPKRAPQNIAGTHLVRRGDTLITIAKRYGVAVSKLRRLNSLRGNTIVVGQRIRVK